MNTTSPSSTAQAAFASLRAYLNDQILGQETLVERLLVALLADGHLLVEGAAGTGQDPRRQGARAGMEGDFQRVQFTPDMPPADLTGSDIYRPEEGSFRFQRGPLFHHLILADEINRAPAKVQSALLEAMAERQISVGAATYLLPRLFLVMATQNPIEHEGVYPLPEAQLDRFMLHTLVDYPDRATTRRIMDLARREIRTIATRATTATWWQKRYNNAHRSRPAARGNQASEGKPTSRESPITRANPLDRVRRRVRRAVPHPVRLGKLANQGRTRVVKARRMRAACKATLKATRRARIRARPAKASPGSTALPRPGAALAGRGARRQAPTPGEREWTMHGSTSGNLPRNNGCGKFRTTRAACCGANSWPNT